MAPFFRRRKRPSKATTADDAPPSDASVPYEPYFGETRSPKKAGSRTLERPSTRENGEKLLLDFIKNRLGNRAGDLAQRLLNKNPIKEGSSFSYIVNQSTESSDLEIIYRDLTSGRLYRAGTKFLTSAWANLLLGDKFAVSSNRKQRHELTYTRSSCTCLICLIRAKKLIDSGDAPSEDNASRASSSSSYTPENSAMANFIRPYALPTAAEFKCLGGVSAWRELEIGTIVRLNSRASAKLKFTDDMKLLFGHLSYTGPVSHEEVYRKVTTIGVNYYLYNKGKKERKVYLQGDMVQLNIEMGVVKLPTRPLRVDELGSYYLLYRKQLLRLYIGELVLEGNSLGSFIPTGIKFYVGVGEEGGCCPVYMDHTLGAPRRIGCNELLLQCVSGPILSFHLVPDD